MTREEINDLYRWLQVTYPKRYAKLGEFEETITKDNLFQAYKSYEIFSVMDGYRGFLEKSPYEPAISDIKAYLAEREAKTAQAEEPEPSIDDLPEHHYMRGRYIHAKAFDVAQADRRAGIVKPFKWYVEQYPDIEWKPWASGPPEYWKGTEYTGWERDENGFVRPKGCKPKWTQGR